MVMSKEESRTESRFVPSRCSSFCHPRKQSRRKGPHLIWASLVSPYHGATEISLHVTPISLARTPSFSLPDSFLHLHLPTPFHLPCGITADEPSLSPGHDSLWS